MAIIEYEQRLALRRANLRRGLPDIDLGTPPPGLRPVRIPPSLQPMLESNKENLPPDRFALMEALNFGADQMARENRLGVPSDYIPLPGTSDRLVDLSRYGRGGDGVGGRSGGRVTLGEIAPAGDAGGILHIGDSAHADVGPERLLHHDQDNRRNSMPVPIASAFHTADVGEMGIDRENMLPQSDTPTVHVSMYAFPLVFFLLDGRTGLWF